MEVTAESLYEAAILGVSLLRQEGWVGQIGPGTTVSVLQLTGDALATGFSAGIRLQSGAVIAADTAINLAFGNPFATGQFQGRWDSAGCARR